MAAWALRARIIKAAFNLLAAPFLLLSCRSPSHLPSCKCCCLELASTGSEARSSRSRRPMLEKAAGTAAKGSGMDREFLWMQMDGEIGI
jgi:hypothetical protein